MLTALFLLVLTVAGVAVFAARLEHPGPDSGEFWSDANIINGCRGYDQAGFTATWGLPRIQLAAPLDDTAALYLSYPPGPYWISYASWSVGRALGVDPVLAARLFAQACGLLSALLAYLVFTRLARSAAIGGLAGLFYVLSPAFLCYSAALHHMAYSPLLLLGAMRAWLAFEDGIGRRRVLWLGLTALLFAADCWTNLEHMFFFALFVGARAALHFRWPVLLGAMLIGPIPVPMMALRVLHNAQVLGGWDAAMAKFRSSASRRSTGGRFGVDLEQLATAWLARLDWPIGDRAGVNQAWNQEFVFPAANPWVVAALAVIAVSLVLHWLVGRRQGGPKALPLSLVDPSQVSMPLGPAPEAPLPPRFLFWTLRAPGPIASGLLGGLLLLAGGLTWFVVMTQHTQPHRFIVLLLMPGLALLLGTVCWWVIESVRRATRDRSGVVAWWLRVRAWIVVALLLGVFAAQVRRADVLNQLTPLDQTTHARVVSRIEANRRVALAGPALAAQGVERVHLFDGANVMPWRAASIGLPFLYARVEMPQTIGPDDALYAEAWDPLEIAACLDAVERFGLPDLVSPPSDRTVVFRGSRAPGDRDVVLDMALTAPSVPTGQPGLESPPALVLRSLRWGPTLLDDQAAAVLWITGDLSQGQPEAVLNRYTFTLRIRTPQGSQHEVRMRLRWAPIRDDGRALLLLVGPAAAITPDAVVELAIWDRREAAPVIFPEAEDSPLERQPGGRWLRWPATGVWPAAGPAGPG